MGGVAKVTVLPTIPMNDENPDPACFHLGTDQVEPPLQFCFWNLFLVPASQPSAQYRIIGVHGRLMVLLFRSNSVGGENVLCQGREAFSAVLGHLAGLSQHEITGFRNVLIRMNDEGHALFEDDSILFAQVAREG